MSQREKEGFDNHVTLREGRAHLFPDKSNTWSSLRLPSSSGTAVSSLSRRHSTRREPHWPTAWGSSMMWFRDRSSICRAGMSNRLAGTFCMWGRSDKRECTLLPTAFIKFSSANCTDVHTYIHTYIHCSLNIHIYLHMSCMWVTISLYIYVWDQCYSKGHTACMGPMLQ